jgi:carboxymethylenebutenolidase
VRIELPSGTPAELALPAGRPSRGVALAPDIGGLRPLFDELCATLAADHGWAVCAPEPFAAHADAPVEDRLQRVRTLVDDRQVGDLTAAADELRRRTGVDRVAVLGFCMGGMYALKAAATGAFDRGVSFYGMIRVPEEFDGPGHRHPIDLLAPPEVPILAIVGGRDQHYTPTADVDDLEAAGASVVRYPEAEHGFVHDPTRPTHRPDDAADAWRRVVDFLRVTAPGG